MIAKPTLSSIQIQFLVLSSLQTAFTYYTNSRKDTQRHFYVSCICKWSGTAVSDQPSKCLLISKTLTYQKCTSSSVKAVTLVERFFILFWSFGIHLQEKKFNRINSKELFPLVRDIMLVAELGLKFSALILWFNNPIKEWHFALGSGKCSQLSTEQTISSAFGLRNDP